MSLCVCCLLLWLMSPHPPLCLFLLRFSAHGKQCGGSCRCIMAFLASALDSVLRWIDGLYATKGHFLFDTNATELCIHGTWDDTNHTCTCDAGWSTSVDQDALGGLYIWCNSSISQPPPGNGSPAPILNGSLLGFVIFLALLLLTTTLCIIIACCWCCCRGSQSCFDKRRSSAAGQAVAPQHQEPPPQMVFGLPAHNQQWRTYSTDPIMPTYMMTDPMYTNSNLGLPAVPVYHNIPNEPISAFFINEPCSMRCILPMDPREQAAAEYYHCHSYPAHHLPPLSDALNGNHAGTHGEGGDAVGGSGGGGSGASVAITGDAYCAQEDVFHFTAKEGGDTQ